MTESSQELVERARRSLEMIGEGEWTPQDLLLEQCADALAQPCQCEEKPIAPCFIEEPHGAIFIYVCELCGQPLEPESECASGIHTSPNCLQLRGRPVRSDVIVSELAALREKLAEAVDDRDTWETRSDVIVETMESYKSRAESAEARLAKAKRERDELVRMQEHYISVIARAVTDKETAEAVSEQRVAALETRLEQERGGR